MTKESLEKGEKIRNKIAEIEHTIEDIKPYFNQTVEISIQNPDRCTYNKPIGFKIQSDSPLWLAIGSALEDMRTELINQFADLGCNSDKVETTDPIKETSTWKKVWTFGGKKKFI